LLLSITAFTVNQNVGTGNSVQFSSLGVGTAASGTAGEVRATNNITAYYSDDKLKTRLGNIENALAKVMSLNGFQYEANETAQALGYKVKPEIGLSAQEVQAVLPEVVVPAPIDEKYLTIHYERVIPLLVEAIKELKREIDFLKK
jgi:DNA recombination-dependent growth factor C